MAFPGFSAIIQKGYSHWSTVTSADETFRPGQVREFIRILKLHRDHPADLIERAVIEALEYGCVHFDGVQLCLRQLTSPEMPVSPIDLTEWPQLVSVGSQMPDLTRYDRLLERV